jgi:hypothetical protein
LSSSQRSQVWHVRLGDRPAVVKQITGGADPDRRFAREVAALRVAAAVRPPVVPMLLGADPATRVLVLEHLVGQPTGAGWPVAYARGLAALHAAPGAGSSAAGAPELPGELPRWAGPTQADIAACLRLAHDLGVTGAGGRAAEELSASVARVAGLPHRALLHGDPCPDNGVCTGLEVRFFDLEHAALGPGLIELAYLRMAFPTCWCAMRIPERELLAAETAYCDVWAGLMGTRPPGRLADACVNWLIRGDALVEMAHRDGRDHLAALIGADWDWGTASARQRLRHRLGVVADITAADDDLRGVHHLTRAMAEQVATRWPGLAPLPDRERLP